jgi:hypothetical protein
MPRPPHFFEPCRHDADTPPQPGPHAHAKHGRVTSDPRSRYVLARTVPYGKAKVAHRWRFASGLPRRVRFGTRIRLAYGTRASEVAGPRPGEGRGGIGPQCYKNSAQAPL